MTLLAACASANELKNADFEEPVLAPNIETPTPFYTFSHADFEKIDGVNPARIPGWKFSLSHEKTFAGIITPLGFFKNDHMVLEPRNGQAAFIENDGSIAQDVTLAAGAYQLIIDACGWDYTGANPLKITIGKEEDITEIKFGTPVTLTPGVKGWTTYTSEAFTVSGDTNELKITGTGDKGQVSAIDNVRIERK